MSVSIESLVADLTPVRRLSPVRGGIAVLAATAAVVTAVALSVGLRADVAMLRPGEIVMLRSGVLAMLGLAALVAVLASARPAVGKRSDGWRWALAAAALFPITSAVLMMRGDGFPSAVLTSSSAPWCIGISLTAAGVIGGVLVTWLRQGAVTNLARAGWLTGLAAGAFGTFAYSLHCPSESVHYIALWYSLAIGASAVLARALVPRLIRW